MPTTDAQNQRPPPPQTKRDHQRPPQISTQRQRQEPHGYHEQHRRAVANEAQQPSLARDLPPAASRKGPPQHRQEPHGRQEQQYCLAVTNCLSSVAKVC